MCDYSLAGLPNRLAMEGEELVVHRFRTGSKGLTPPVELRPAEPLQLACKKSFWEWLKSAFEDAAPSSNITAVCVPPGAQLLLRNIPPDLRREWSVEDEEKVLFVQVSGLENTYRDAIHFRYGRQVLLQDLREGMLVQVLSLGGVEVNDEHRLVAQPS